MAYSRTGLLPAVFNTQDETIHKQMKTPIAPLFSISNIITYEPLVDTVLDVTCKALDDRFAKTGKVFDLTDWLQYYAFDVMGTLTFSKRYGFLEQGRDIDGMLLSIWNYMRSVAPVSKRTKRLKHQSRQGPTALANFPAALMTTAGNTNSLVR